LAATAEPSLATRLHWGLRAEQSTFLMAVILLVLGFLLIWPIILIFIMSLNTAPEMFVGPRVWGLDNWLTAFTNPRIPRAIANTFLVWGLQFCISMPISILIAWTLARTRIPFSRGLEFMFWIAYITPGSVVSWILLLDPDIGFLNTLARQLPFFPGGILDIYSVGGIVWVGIMSNGIALKVMLLTPAFRNMDAALEEAARVGGATSLRTMLRVTVPLMISPIALVAALQIMRIFQSFEAELLLGVPINFYVYSTLIYELVRRHDPPLYGEATVLASVTLLVLAFIIPLQRWILQRRRYTTISGQFKPGLTEIGPLKWPAFGFIVGMHLLMTVVPVGALVLGSLMRRLGYFQISSPLTLEHWRFVLTDSHFLTALKTTLILTFGTAILSPVLFSMLAYILVRTRWRGRSILDSVVWVSAAIPGMLTSLGMLMVFLGTPGLSVLYGTIAALLIVVLLQGNTTGVNITKATIVQVGADMEEAARVAGAGWLKTYFKIWLPLLMPTLVTIGTLHFVIAANTTSSIILLAARDTITLSILVLELAMPTLGMREAASVVNMVIMGITLGAAFVARFFGFRLGVQHH
jgi:iron(III) transport system permease protein